MFGNILDFVVSIYTVTLRRLHRIFCGLPFAAIDIDHCVENGILSPLASDIVTHSKSYTEYSPSGKGVRIILTVPDGFKYDKARYYICTAGK